MSDIGPKSSTSTPAGGSGGATGSYTQDKRPLAVKTPLGKDKLLLVGFSGQEAISKLFNFQLQALATNKDAPSIAFDKVLGKSVTVDLELADGSFTHFNGIAIRMAEGGRGETFTDYALEIVPKFWTLTRRTQSRIFKQQSVPDILKVVLAGLNVSYKIQGTFEPRDYCTQYCESDFNFASRLMEEEGIYYYFEHSDGDHQMVVANTPSSHVPLAFKPTIIYDELAGGERDDDRIHNWMKTQELRSGKSTLWDHAFELPHQHLDAQKTIQTDVAVGTVSHSLQVGGNDKFELYDYPGDYAQRYDGSSPGGGEQLSEVQKVFTDNVRTVGIRMEEEAFHSIRIQGKSKCRQFTSGHKFTLTRHPNANGDYVLLSVWHTATLGAYRTNHDNFTYHNTLTAFPFGLPFRPPQINEKPSIYGTQTAVVVGPDGQEIFTDDFGRVKVHFHWDRVSDENSSCWARVAQPTAGNRWGSSFWPRIGQEVVVDFEHGDPDYPIVVGTVYNAKQMPPYLGNGPDSKHTNDNKVSGFKTCSTMGGQGYNELRFDDTKGSEEIYIHAERNLDERVEENTNETVGNNRSLIVGSTDTKWDKTGDQMEEIYHDKHLKIHNNQEEEIGGTFKLHVKGNTDELFDADVKKTTAGDEHLHVKGNRNEKVDGDQSLMVQGKHQENTNESRLIKANVDIHMKTTAGKICLESAIEISLTVGANTLVISPAGVTIVGMPMVNINSGGSAPNADAASPTAPTDAVAAAPKAPTVADTSKPGTPSNAS